MNKSPKDKKTFSYIIKLPFLGIFYIVDYFLKAVNLFFIGFATTFKPFITFFKYVSLGCYYTLYGLLFPFIFTFSKVLDILFKNSNKKKVANTIKIEEFIPIEENEEETEEKVEDKKLSVEDYLKQKYEDFYFVKKQKEKEDEQARALIREIQKNNLRSETPLVFKYLVRDTDGKKYSNIFIN